MKIESYIKHRLYVVRYNNEPDNVLEYFLEEFQRNEFLTDFFNKYKYNISPYLQTAVGIKPHCVDEWVNKVRIQVMEFQNKIYDLEDEYDDTGDVDFHHLFEEYEGNENRKYNALKCYCIDVKTSASNCPSLIRVWAIEVGKAIVILYAGIKLQHAISQCPVLNEELNQKIAQVCDFLKAREVKTVEDLDHISE